MNYFEFTFVYGRRKHEWEVAVLKVLKEEIRKSVSSWAWEDTGATFSSLMSLSTTGVRKGEVRMGSEGRLSTRAVPLRRVGNGQLAAPGISVQLKSRPWLRPLQASPRPVRLSPRPRPAYVTPAKANCALGRSALARSGLRAASASGVRLRR
jgi:hypothetical protein